jgi:hypothetical protein
VARSGEFNTTSLAVAIAAVLVARAEGSADEIRKWRDAAGRVHYSITGSPGAPSDANDSADRPILEGRDATPEESFSVDASLRRRDIEKKLTSSGRELEEIRAEIQKTEKREFGAWVPSVTGDPRSAQASLDRQRDALLAAGQFEREKADTLRHLRRREHEELKELAALWKDFAALGDEVSRHYGGTAPAWWRNRLDCGSCPTAAEVDQALHKPREKPAANEEKKTAKRHDSQDDDDEGWEDAWE